MGGLQKFENRLESFISGVFARAFRSAVQPVEIVAALERELDNNTQILSRERRLVPNDFHVELSESDLERLAPYDSTLAHELAEQLRDYADQQGYVFPGKVSIDFAGAEDLTTGRFRVRSQAQASVESTSTSSQASRARAFLEVNGARHPLTPPSAVVGRGSDADIRVNDPGVSRHHAQLDLDTTSGQLRVSVRDLGSTNGIQVDGHRVQKVSVRDGSEITIGHTTLTVRVEER